ncbi:methyltransferase [Rhodospirillum rubrum]|uniref:SAM-dependent methyltransferase n=1 Tax=Rhodospirillum rubrum TaxID=1085 RepID=UPI0019043401|nr:methyltransferase [Rhodospirillum rubrum]
MGAESSRSPGAAVEALIARLRNGPLPVEDWMAACLGEYYARGDVLGAGGDFITAPECTQIFGELLGLWSAVVWRSMGSPERINLVELGPGRGTLMADALRALAPVPEFRRALSVHLVETSPGLRARQKQKLRAGGVTVFWHERLDTVPPGPMIVLANEFLDALPIRQYLCHAEGWRERLVALAGEGTALTFTQGPLLGGPPPLAQPAHLRARVGEEIEVCPQAQAVVAQVAARLAAEGGAGLFLDYGPAHSAPGDSLQALRRHRFAAVLENPGAVDLTAHVDFQAMAQVAAAAGAAVDGIVQQGPFLQSLGLEARAGVLLANAAVDQKREIRFAVRRLIDSSEMGTLFKVLGLRSPSMARLPGF